MVVNVKEYIKEYDLAFYNQETIFGGPELGFSSYPRFNTPSEFGDAMLESGFNIVGLANNHSFDKGERGIMNALQYWQDKDVIYSGIADSKESQENYQIKTMNNISYTMLSYTTLTNGLKAPAGKEYMVNVYNEDLVRKDILAVRKNVDVLIVSMHWGVEYTNNPNSNQLEIARFLSDLGVDIIIGHHPHVLQPIEIINNTVVMYSLGNFISAQDTTDKLIGALVGLNITKTVKENSKEINISIPEVELIYTSRDYTVILFHMMSTKYLSNYQYYYDKYNNILTKMEPGVIVHPLN